MTETVHRIWRYTPVLMEEHMTYEDGELWPDQVGETYKLDLPGQGISFECECGEEFGSREEAKQHIEEVNQ